MEKKLIDITDHLVRTGPEKADNNQEPPGLSSKAYPTKMLVILFTDIVGSTALKAELGDRVAKILDDEHKRLLLDALEEIENAQVLRVEGDAYIFLFHKPGDAVQFALHAQALHRKARGTDHPRLPEFRVGIHIGEVVVEDGLRGPAVPGEIGDIKGLQADTTARIMGLATGGQILCSRAVFDDARQALKGAEMDGIRTLNWQNHGFYVLKGREDPMEICEVGEEGITPFLKPEGNEKAKPTDSPDRQPELPTSENLGQKSDLPRVESDSSFSDRQKTLHTTKKLLYSALAVLAVFTIAIFIVRNIGGIKSLLGPKAESVSAESAVDKLKYEVIRLRGVFETMDDYGAPAFKEVREKSPRLARQILNLDDSIMGSKHKILKYQFAATALVMAASVEPDKTEQLSYADQAISSCHKGIALAEKAIQQASGGNENAQKLYEWITSDRRTEFMQYLLAVSYAIKARTGDASAFEKVERHLNAIPSAYKDRYPPDMEPNLKWVLTQHPDRLKSSDTSSDSLETEPVRNSETAPDLFALSSLSQDESGEYRALIIGIDEYEDENIPALKNAGNDAEAVANILRERYGFAEIKLLMNRNATKKEIRKALRDLRKAGPKESVLIYYSGHGELDRLSKEKKDGWWIPADAIHGDIDTYLDNILVLKEISNMKARHILLISDSCYAGTLFGETRALPLIGQQLYRELYDLESRWGMTSGNKHPVSDKGSGGHSVFASELLKVLKKNNQPYLSIREIFARIRTIVSNNSEQIPVCRPLQNTGDQGGEFVFLLSGGQINLKDQMTNNK